MEHKKIKRKRWIISGIVLLVLIIFVWYENHHLVVSSYDYKSSKISGDLEGYRIVQISDLHNAEFGKNNKNLITKIAELSPDLIVVTGDLVDSNHMDIDVAVNFIEDISGICPIYYVMGNHEHWLSDADRQDLFEGIKNTDTTVLDNEGTTINAGKASFELIGLDDKSLGDDTLKNLMNGCSNDDLTIVLAHEPQYINNFSAAKADIVLSGHAHGGQFILPFVGAVVAPGQGFFPKYTSGAYQMKDTTMYVSRGLGNSVIPVRLFNDPEVVCIDLRK
ncbi:metallophosphoesterase [Anaerobium acetethylicum]|uniref:Calcineurin-like phosphoesterase domain-containing protein n=1 Tax=Anaerobium acetethylicum TaxID=1619234 RepID=A0A1D3TYS1_9FIRM|nr:metallophosphoesterase [Anaerobium acetethylicum]SCP99629.1 hypothetical protein SAMN05421730_10506 [Anaerobium acetethylicum]